MKKILIYALMIAACISCDQYRDYSDDDAGLPGQPYRQRMRDFVQGISAKAKAAKPGFLIIPQNGIELVTNNDANETYLNVPYLAAIDGNGQEDLYFGYDQDDVATPTATTAYLKSYLDISKAAGNTILAVDYCSTPSKMAASYQNNANAGFTSFAAPQRSLNVIPATAPYMENSTDINTLSDAKNFLFLINPENYTTKTAFINAVKATNYDLVIMDLFLDDVAFTQTEITELKTKANGGKRLMVCYMSIGEAENYRYYWNSGWPNASTPFIKAENPDWPGNYKVEYWDAQWQGIIFKNNDSYLDRIINAGFDGTYLDIIDAFEYFEK